MSETAPTAAESRNLPVIYQWIVTHTPEGGRVLDIGCGDGALLARLVEERRVRATGIELSEDSVRKAILRGLSVHHGNVEEGLDHYADGSLDLVVISLTIQELGDPRKVMSESFRVGKRVVVVFPNFGHWVSRWQLAVQGTAPSTPSLPYTWYDSPNRHYLTVVDWDRFCREEGYRCVDRAFAAEGSFVSVLPNLRAEVAMYLLDRA